jgi:hypothetical protein
MATDSNSKLTKFETATTIVTSEFANSIFGGLYESAEGDLLDPNDPQVIGHIHDGDVGDGHCGFIHLQDHVTSKLLHENLADEAVRVNNVWTSLDETEAIPEYVVKADGKIWYYLDLSEIRGDFTFKQIGYAPSDPEIEPGYDPAADEELNPDPTTSDTAKPLIRHGDDDYTADGFDFVFGSASLDDMHGMGHPNPFDGIPLDGLGDSRFLFDKSESAFRAGSVDGDQWDESKRGRHSVAFGQNNTASEEGTVVSGGLGNTASEECSTVSGGSTNTATEQYSTTSGGHMNNATEQASTVSGGESNIAAGAYSAVSGGQSNVSNDSFSSIGGGRFNLIDNGSTYSVITGGGGVDVATKNTIDNASTYSAIGGGTTNTIDNASTYSAIGGGTTNTIDNASTHSAIGGGTTNTIDDGSTHSIVAGGDTNKIIDASGAAPSTYSSIGGGRYNLIDNGSTYSVISGGGGDDASKGNIVDNGSTYSIIGGGTTNTIDNASTHSIVAGGDTNKIIDASGAAPSTYSAIGGGRYNLIDNGSTYSVISGGGGDDASKGNIIDDGSTYSAIGGGSLNKINDTTSGAPSEYSVVAGGYSNEIDHSPSSVISGGYENKIESENGFIGGGVDNDIGTMSSLSVICGGGDNGGGGALVGNSISGSTMSVIGGGSGNAIKVTSGKSVIAGGTINVIESSTESVICGGTGNNVVSSPLGCVVSGSANMVINSAGVCSSIVSGLTNVVDAHDVGHVGPSGSPGFNMILSGDLNFIHETSFAAILSGHNNVIDGGSSASVIVAGVENNIDTGSDYSGILSGAKNKLLQSSGNSAVVGGYANEIGSSTYCTIIGGKGNVVDLANCSTAFGQESKAYSHGQASHAGSRFGLEDFTPGGYANGIVVGDWSVLGDDGPGSSQSFAVMMSGHWQYDKANLIAFLAGAPLAPDNFVSYLDGDTQSGGSAKWFPRQYCSYLYVIDAVLNFTEENALTKSTHHSISFSFSGGLTTQPDGSIEYRNNLSPLSVSFSTGSNVGIPNDPATGPYPDDFEIFFTHDIANPTNNSAVAGPWSAPVYGDGFAIVVKNRGHNTGNRYVGESLVARIKVIEIGIQAYMDNT